jgi:hypothetical protein
MSIAPTVYLMCLLGSSGFLGAANNNQQMEAELRRQQAAVIREQKAVSKARRKAQQHKNIVPSKPHRDSVVNRIAHKR